MSTVPISTKCKIMTPAAVRKDLSLQSGMRVSVKVNGKSVITTPALTKRTVSLNEIRQLLKYDGLAVAVSDIRVTGHKG